MSLRSSFPGSGCIYSNVRKMVKNCRGNPPALAGLPMLRAATGGRPYKILFGSNLSGLGKL